MRIPETSGVKAEYIAIEKCNFGSSFFKKSKNLKFSSVSFPGIVSTNIVNDGVVSLTSRGVIPVLNLVEQARNSQEMKTRKLTFGYKWVDTQPPGTWFTKFDMKPVGKAKPMDEQVNFLNFGKNIPIRDCVKHYIEFSGKESIGEDEFNVELNIDVAYSLELANNKILFISYYEGPEVCEVVCGSRKALERLGKFKLNWIRLDEHIKLKSIKLV